MFWSAMAAGGADDRAPESDFWYGPVGAPTSSGVRVTPHKALALPAVYAATRVITDALMQIPLFLYRRLDNEGKERAKEHTLYKLLHRQPNQVQTSSEWRELMHHPVLLRGNAYSEIIRDDTQSIVQLGMPIHPDTVTPIRIQRFDGSIRYNYRIVANEHERIVDQDDLLHIRGLGIASDGISGLSPIEMEREAIGAGLAAQDFTGRFFSNDARPGGWIEHPTNFKTDEQRKKFLSSWKNSQTGANRLSTAVLEYGMKYNAMDIKLVDAQFLESRKYTNLDVARIFRVPPHLIMELDRATFSNITQQDIEFVKFTMLPWLIRWEQRLSMSLLTESEQEEYFFEFLVDGLERGDGEARSKYYKAGIQDGWLTRNEVRKRENMNPIDGLDEPLEPLNMRNPGGENDERLNAVRENAAQALVRRQRHEASRADDPAAFLRNDWPKVKQFMLCSDSDAQRYSDFSARLYEDDAKHGPVLLAAWEARQVKLAMEML